MEDSVEFIEYCKENKCRQCQVNYAEHLKRFDIIQLMYNRYRIRGHECPLK